MFKYIAVQLIGLTGLTGRLAAALEFWIYDTLKITVILLGVVFAVSYLRTYLPPEKIRDFLKGKKAIVGYALAGVLGIISPFCSCSTVPLFLGFVGVGVPFGMTITFLTVSPMVNTAAVFVLFGSFGWSLTLAYVLGGLIVGIVGGGGLKLLGFERYVVDFDFAADEEEGNDVSDKSARQRLREAYEDAREIVGRIFPYVVIGVGLGAAIHGFLPEQFIQNTLQGALAVPAATALGIPIYTNIMGVIPVAESLIGKGLPAGTSIAFMMSVAALSVPQFVLLKQVMKRNLIIAYGGIIGFGIMILGFIFNLIF
ncbi:permease [Candidatus Bipolaricaulota bacterium]|nr:permease [Candidatus Bipolaricaulota bacterium]MBS3825067.1 permease [Candidatus Bipolaricaulota bacterium]